MSSATTLRKIRQIELRTRKLVNNSFAGAYHAVFKGRGIVFDAVRPYEPGDDVRDIDWKVTARAGEPFVRRYIEERELTVMLVLDTSASFRFGTVGMQKRDLAAEFGAVLAMSAITNNDKVGLLLFSDTVELFIPPRKGRKHVLRLIRELLAAPAEHRRTDIGLALQMLRRYLKRRAIVFFISDFLADLAPIERDFVALGREHDVIAVVTTDALEQQFPDVGLVAIRDAEGGGVQWVDTHTNGWQGAFAQRAESRVETRTQVFLRAQMDSILLDSRFDYVRALTQFFQRRGAQKRRAT
ncbi:MAG: DUF58 domain-containing protein [Phototrophicaceae bacterium]|jgi:uncharacterized protein (DUF58 family)